MDWTHSWATSDVEAPDTIHLAPDSGTRELAWSVAGPFTPAHVLEAAEEIDRVTRFLAHATQQPQAHTAVPCGKDLHRLISALCAGLGRLDQVLLQVRHRARDCVIASEGSACASDIDSEAADLLQALGSAAEQVRDAVATMASARHSSERFS